LEVPQLPEEAVEAAEVEVELLLFLVRVFLGWQP
jgi:hypothetical protein